jgi:hypothetical protein
VHVRHGKVEHSFLGRIEMSGRSRQWAVVLLVVTGLTLFLAGCGVGGGSSTTSSSLANTTRTTATPSVGSAIEDLLLTKLATTKDTPEEYVAAIGQARPVVLLFYVPGNVDDTKVKEAFDAVQPDFPDYTFLTYDYKSPSAYGNLSMLLKVNYPPEIVLVDKAGTVRSIWNGYVDEGTLKQCLINLGQG